MTLETKTENVLNDIEPITEKVLTLNAEKDIRKSNWTRICPMCNEIIEYNSWEAHSYGKSNGVKCKKCRKISKTEMYFRNCPNCNRSISTPNLKYYKKCIKLNNVCKSCSLTNWHKKKLHTIKVDIPDRKCPLCNQTLSKYISKKIRMCKTCTAKRIYSSNPNVRSRLSYGAIHNRRRGGKSPNQKIYPRTCPNCNRTLKHTSITYVNKNKHRMCKSCSGLSRLTPYYNPFACKIIDLYGKKYNYNFQHAENSGEFKILHYSVDGYDKDKNIVIEYDEFHHFDSNGTLSIRDIDRMIEISSYLKCIFIRIKNDGDDYIILDYRTNIPRILKCDGMADPLD